VRDTQLTSTENAGMDGVLRNRPNLLYFAGRSSRSARRRQVRSRGWRAVLWSRRNYARVLVIVAAQLAAQKLPVALTWIVGADGRRRIFPA